MKKRKKYQHRDKPWMCDPGMCDHCVYIGEGDFICDKGPGEPVIVVEDWVPNEDAGRCRRGPVSGFKVAEVANSKNDEFYTPAYAITPLLRHLPPPYSDRPISIWCPFDTEESLFVRIFRLFGYQVTATHLSTGKDFFSTEPPACDYIISNPPYSLKGEVLERLFDLGKPFAMLVGVVGLFESQRRFEMFRAHDFEIMYFNRRVAYFKSYEDPAPSLNPPFSSVYVCKGILPKTIVFEEIAKR